MNELNKITAQLADLDVYTQRSVIGSWAFFVNSQCINQGVRILPDVPEEGEGIEGYTAWEGAIRTAERKLVDGERNGGDFAPQLPAWVALQRFISFMMVESGGEASTIQSTFDYLSERSPTRQRFENEFAMRVKMGMRPGITRKEFVDSEYARAMDQHVKLMAKGEHAVQMLDRMVLATGAKVERGFDDLPDWVAETLQQKLVQKLKDRWTRLEITRTNPRVNAANRDAAEGDQFLIVEVLKAYGEVPHEPVVHEEDELELELEAAAATPEQEDVAPAPKKSRTRKPAQ